MSWLRIDDTVPHHQKCLKAGPAASWLWVCALAYCQRHLTDGFIPTEAVPFLGVARGADALIEKLCEVTLMEHADGGYRVHDYHDHNATADEARARKAAVSQRRSQAGRAGGLRSGIARSNEAKLKQTDEANLKQTSSNVAKQNEAPSHPIPIKTPLTPHADARGVVRIKPTRQERAHAARVLQQRFGRCQHDPGCASSALCLLVIVRELREKARPRLDEVAS